MYDPLTVAAVAVADLTTGVEPLPAALLSWRWSDQEHGRWLALLRVRTPSLLQYERWVDGEYVRRVE